MNRLEARFEEFFEALWRDPKRKRSWRPFSWQTRLAARVNRSGWPEGIDLPTGSGKTACLEIALFTLACQADRAPRERTAPRRIFFVIDRRIVVDQVLDRALEIRDRLEVASNGILFEVAERLRRLSGGHGQAVTVHQMRGGAPRDLDWVVDPSQPAIIASTVDQTGSRLLFRPYGSRAESAPVHAGLVGNDSLILLDEAHCSVPFLETARAVARYRSWGEKQIFTQFRFVVLSATLPDAIESDDRFELGELSPGQEDADQVLRDRLIAGKPTRLLVASGAKGMRAQERLAAVIAEEAIVLAKDRKAIGIMVNRVRTARLVHERLAGHPDSEAILLTGRMRPLDRKDLLAAYQEQFSASSDRKELERVTFFVATQCLEVGADLDFEALVTECSSLDSLRQRFGRLDRLGRHHDAEGVIVVQEGQTNGSEDDPVYGAALSETWRWLSEQSRDGRVDMGIQSLRDLIKLVQKEDPERWRRLQAPTSRAPILLPGHLDYWVQTSPVPSPDPEPALFLHGVDRSAPEVSLAWRADLPEDRPRVWKEVVALCPPTGPELMPVPLWAIRQWMWDRPGTVEAALADVESVPEDDVDSRARGIRRVLVWRGAEESTVVEIPEEIRPGDVLVVPVSAGGWDLFGHLYPPDVSAVEVDRGDQALQEARGRAILRLHSGLFDLAEEAPLRRLAEAVEAVDEEQSAERMIEALREVWEELSSEREVPDWLTVAVRTIVENDARHLVVVLHPHEGWILSSRRQLALSPDENASVGSATEGDEAGSSSSDSAVTLEGHLRDVARRVERLALALDCPESLVQDLVLAAKVHDLGKADPRFQALLHGGDELRASASPLLAKSPGVPFTLSEYRRARTRAGLPVGFRHEAVSLRLFESSSRWATEANDPDLVRFLISSHHGKCRPFLPTFEDEVEIEGEIDGVEVAFRGSLGLASLDSGVSDRFWQLVRRFGWWGLAWLEATLRTADWQVSGEESVGGGSHG